MIVGTPLGPYTHLVAAAIAVILVVAWIVAAFLLSAGILHDPKPVEALGTAALLAVGAVFGSVATTNGVKPAIDAAHTRLDKLQAPSAHDVLRQEQAGELERSADVPPSARR